MSAGAQSEPASRAARIRALLQDSDALIRESRQLRERSRTLRYNSADLREFLREALLTLYSRRERGMD